MPKEKKEKKSKVVDPDASIMTVGDDVDMDNGEASKEKKEKKVKDEPTVLLTDLSPISQPLAQKKLLKKLNKTIKKASKNRQLKRGVKEVVKGIRKGEKGLLILAADISPIDIISHLPVLSEEAQIPYIFVPSKEELGQASATKRPTSCVMVCPNAKAKPAKKKDGAAPADDEDGKDDDYRALYDECCAEVNKLDSAILI